MEGGKRWRNEGGERGERKCFFVGLWGVVCVCVCVAEGGEMGKVRVRRRVKECFSVDLREVR